MAFLDSFEGDVKSLWKRNKVLFLVIVGGIIAVIYLVYKHGSSAFIASTAASTPSSVPTDANAQGLNPAITNSYTSVTYTGIPVPVPPVHVFYKQPAPGQPPNQPPNPNQPPTPNPRPQPQPRVQTIFPAPKGSLKFPQAAGNNDTNWWAYTIGRNQTIGSLAQSFKIGNGSPEYIVNYRNNRDIFNQMGVDTTNTNAPVLAGWIISV